MKKKKKKQVSSLYKFQYTVSCTNRIIIGGGWFSHICWLFFFLFFVSFFVKLSTINCMVLFISMELYMAKRLMALLATKYYF